MEGEVAERTVLERPRGRATVGKSPVGVEFCEEVLLLIVEVVHPLLQRLRVAGEIGDVKNPVRVKKSQSTQILRSTLESVIFISSIRQF